MNTKEQYFTKNVQGSLGVTFLWYPGVWVCFGFFLNSMGGAVKQEEEEAQMDSFRASAETRAGMERAALGSTQRKT